MNEEDEIKKLLRENTEISRESLKILKGIRRANRITTSLKVIYWLIILGAALGAYYYLQPFISKIPGLLNWIQNAQKLLQNIPTFK